ncbi:MAG: hypothetical protein AAFW82_09555, partial [Pseudomonadota bacterium]
SGALPIVSSAWQSFGTIASDILARLAIKPVTTIKPDVGALPAWGPVAANDNDLFEGSFTQGRSRVRHR